MPDRVDLIGEEELMPGKTWLVYRNQSTGQLSKVPKEIMDNPNTGKLMMNHLTGYAMQRGGEPAQFANPEAEFKVQHELQKQRDMAPNPARPWEPPGHDYVSTGKPGQELPVPQSPREVIDTLRQRLSGKPTAPPQRLQGYGLPLSPDPATRLYELGEEQTASQDDRARLAEIRRLMIDTHNTSGL